MTKTKSVLGILSTFLGYGLSYIKTKKDPFFFLGEQGFMGFLIYKQKGSLFFFLGEQGLSSEDRLEEVSCRWSPSPSRVPPFLGDPNFEVHGEFLAGFRSITPPPPSPNRSQLVFTTAISRTRLGEDFATVISTTGLASWPTRKTLTRPSPKPKKALKNPQMRKSSEA